MALEHFWRIIFFFTRFSNLKQCKSNSHVSPIQDLEPRHGTPMDRQPGTFPAASTHTFLTRPFSLDWDDTLSDQKYREKWCHIGVTCSCYSSLWVAGTSKLDCGHFAPMTSHESSKTSIDYTVLFYVSARPRLGLCCKEQHKTLCVSPKGLTDLQACIVFHVFWDSQDTKKKQNNVWIICIMLRSIKNAKSSLWAAISSKRTPHNRWWPPGIGRFFPNCHSSQVPRDRKQRCRRQ